jgi:hypothetical protein
MYADDHQTARKDQKFYFKLWEVIVRAFHVDSFELQVLEMIFETN